MTGILKQLFRTKSLDAILREREVPRHKLKRALGWFDVILIEYAVGNVAVAISWANYFKTFVAGFGVSIPDWLSTDYKTAAKIPGLFESAPHVFGIPAVFNLLKVCCP
jgi:hypothetical protein